MITGDNSTAGGFIQSQLARQLRDATCPGCFIGDGFNNSAAISNSQAFGNVTVGALSVAGGFAATEQRRERPVRQLHQYRRFRRGECRSRQHRRRSGRRTVRKRHDREFFSEQHAGGQFAGANSIVGGVAGVNEGTISDTSSTAPVSGTSDSYIGGITGINLGLVTGSSTDPDITGSGGNNFIGGIAGLNVGSINNSTGQVALGGGTPNYAGGVAGVNAAYSGNTANDPEFEFPDRHDHQFEFKRQRLHQSGWHDFAELHSRPALLARRLH